MTDWRFDQGRLDYFQFDEIVRSSRALLAVDGVPKPLAEHDVIRESLAVYSAQPYHPIEYTVWRNYKRVFGCQLLASEVDGAIRCTQLCRQLASEPTAIDVDDYLAHFSTHFYYPSPIFLGYDLAAPQVFPVLAMLKLLLSRVIKGADARISVDDVRAFLIANQVSGLEKVGDYHQLTPRPVEGDERQVRELMVFVSQFSFLSWENPYLEYDSHDESLLATLVEVLRPNLNDRRQDRGEEILRLGSRDDEIELPSGKLTTVDPSEQSFREGGKERVSHLRTERSRKLRELYFRHNQSPEICHACGVNTNDRYPWTEHVIELHHVLPLSAPVRVETGHTSLADIVGLCPSCHRAIHAYYSWWLRENHRSDFNGADEARRVYEEAAARIADE